MAPLPALPHSTPPHPPPLLTSGIPSMDRSGSDGGCRGARRTGEDRPSHQACLRCHSVVSFGKTNIETKCQGEAFYLGGLVSACLSLRLSVCLSVLRILPLWLSEFVFAVWSVWLLG